MSIQLDKEIYNYLSALEDTNEQLVNALKQCVKLLSQVSTPNQQEWQKIIDQLQETIKTAEKPLRIKSLISLKEHKKTKEITLKPRG